MQKIANAICKNRIKILIITIILLIPAIIGMITTKVNYDILVYLPEDIETIKGQKILTEDFNMGAFSVSIIDNMSSKDILNLEKNIKKIKGVEKVLTSYNLLGTTIPLEMIPEDILKKMKKDDSDLMLITFRSGTSSEETLKAIEEIKKVTKDQTKIGGMSALVLDTMNLSETEIFVYISVAVILCIIVLLISLDSYIVPFLLLINIGISILFNLGTNIIFGNISYITKALVAVLQLGVTTDFSIFLYHAYENAKKKNKDNIKSMSIAIHETFTSVVGSSLTTIAGFLVLITMDLTLGRDLGLVMAKGVLLGVISVLTVFPSILLVFDKIIEKTKHKSIVPNFTKLNSFIIKHNKIILIIFLILIIPAYFANSKVQVYYKLDESLPKNLDCIIANNELKEKFNIVSPEIILTDKNMSKNKLTKMLNEIEELDGIDFVLSFNNLENLGITKEILNEEILNIFESNKYELILINSSYEIASEELNSQINKINKIINKYDKKAILAGEGPLMKDLVTISDNDFKNVNISSIICILIIMLLVLKSLSLPILLIIVIEFAIFINMSIPYFSGLELPFVAPIVLGTIQLGATIDYAILLTTTYLKEKKRGLEKESAINEVLNTCIPSILVSGLCFFGATFGVGIFSKLEMISSLCTLISRGAIISMIVVIFILPTVLLNCDKLIINTTYGYKKKGENMKNKTPKILGILLIITISIYSLPLNALTKEETVYGKLNTDGSLKTIIVNEHLINDNNDLEIIDETNLNEILNINGEEKYTKDNNKITWEYKGNDIYYKGTLEKELPIKIEIKYYLNDEEKQIEEIIGKSGNIKIKINYTNIDAHNKIINGKNEIIYTPFLVTTGMIIKGENNKNINVDNGKVINNGKDNILLTLSSPGLYESLKIDELKNLNEVTINLETTKFELPNIYTVITPKLLDESDLEIFNKMNNIYNQTSILNNSIDEIQNGAHALVDATGKLRDGTEQIYENLQVVITSLESLNSGAVKIDEGLKEILKNLQNTKYLLTGINTADLTILIKSNEQTINTLKTLDPQANANLIELLTKNNEALIKISTLSNTVNDVINTLEKYLTELENGSTKISDGTNKLKEGVKVLTEKTGELKTGMYSLNKGTENLYTGIETFNNNGIKNINNLINGKIKNIHKKVEALIELNENYNTFTLKTDETKSSTKFILNINGIKSNEDKKITQKEVKKETVWTRVKNLFK